MFRNATKTGSHKPEEKPEQILLRMHQTNIYEGFCYARLQQGKIHEVHNYQARLDPCRIRLFSIFAVPQNSNIFRQMMGSVIYF